MSDAQKPNEKTSYYYKLFRVRRADGRVTTVSINPILATQACKAMGGLQSVGAVVRTAAKNYTDGQSKNCSHYVSECLRSEITRITTERRNATHNAVAA